jgi:Rrf2 family protein
MISKKAVYGLKAILHLAKRHQAGPVLITDLAKEEGLPQKFLEAILLELRKSGLLESKKGKGGGYSLSKAPSEISLGEVIRTLDGPFAEISLGAQNGEENEVGLIMKEVKDAVSNILDRTSLSDVIERAQNGQNVLNYMI